MRSELDARLYGLNCAALGHLVVQKLFAVELPPELDAYEMYTNIGGLFVPVDQAPMQQGDFVWFGRQSPEIPVEAFIPVYAADGDLLNWPEFAVHHLAIYTGENDNGDPLLLHASPTAVTNEILPLSQFAQCPRYAQTYGVSRFVGASATPAE